jgi:hypothetical protein
MTEENTEGGKHSVTFFTVDGTFGCAHSECVRVVETTRFTKDDWDVILNASDSERMNVALEIAKQRNPD